MSSRPRHVIEFPDTKITMAFRLIPAGEFRMGARGVHPPEEPVHRVRLSQSFWMAETPVTQKEFAVWTGSDAYTRWRQLTKVTGVHENGFDDRPSHPAEHLTWFEATAFCE